MLASSFTPVLAAPVARRAAARRTAIVVRAAATTVTTLSDGRKVEVYKTTAEQTAAVAQSFVTAYKAVSSSSHASLGMLSWAVWRRLCRRRAPSLSPSPAAA